MTDEIQKQLMACQFKLLPLKQRKIEAREVWMDATRPGKKKYSSKSRKKYLSDKVVISMFVLAALFLGAAIYYTFFR